MQFNSACQLFHSLVVRILHTRLQLAACLDNQTLYLQCGPAAADWKAEKVLCEALGTDGMQELNDKIQDSAKCAGIVKTMGELYTRFRSVTKDRYRSSLPRLHPAGNIHGSRTYVASEAAREKLADASNAVTRTVGIDGQCLFSQLETLIFLGRRSELGILCGAQTICEGTVRVWRDWLSKKCETKRWTDGEPIAIIYEAKDGSRKTRADSITDVPPPLEDSSILWLNTEGQNVGIKFRVKGQNWAYEGPIRFVSNVDLPVSVSEVKSCDLAKSKDKARCGLSETVDGKWRRGYRAEHSDNESSRRETPSLLLASLDVFLLRHFNLLSRRKCAGKLFNRLYPRQYESLANPLTSTK